jgi:type IV pilus assembly protein PilC
MLFTYQALDQTGAKKNGTIDALNKTVAIGALQRRGLIVVSIKGEEDKGILQMTFFEKVPLRDIVVMSRQISTLFSSQISALKAFTLLGTTTENPLLKKQLLQIGNDLQAGSSISAALSRHPESFSSFYIAMVKAGEESGKLNEVFDFLADYLDRQYELTSKARNALIYPAFVVVVFIVVMILMFTMVIPNLSKLLLESGQDVPVYTRIVIAISEFFVQYGVFILIIFAAFGVYLFFASRKESGKRALDNLKISIPFVSVLYKKMYLARIADNLHTMLSSGIPILRSIEITGEVVGNRVYSEIMKKAEESVKAGSSFSKALSPYPEIPPLLTQMIQVGEETGSLGDILKTLSKFYKREVDDAVDTLIGLIEPVMIVLLALGVGVLLAAVLVPIYNIASGIV